MNRLSRECFLTVCGLAWLVAAAGSQQAAPLAAAPVIALQPSVCPVVKPGDGLTLDWNPGMAPESAVAGIARFSLIFGLSTGEGGTLVTHPHGEFSGVALRASAITSLVNGFYHFEFQVPARLSGGVYKLAKAAAVPALARDYQGPAPQMYNSPSSQSFCFTVQGRSVVPQRIP